ncbi:endolytic transglycosylase MltG [Oscillibacter ruminantium]|uniref:endolytic transglycosylase MltG n=1 Tax=Oscillibacter ruminantium TaxID=1263547 RepID=UPI0025AA6D42|nr:endolytic transglycosylase MltG [Oscillibacter valericigenes]
MSEFNNQETASWDTNRVRRGEEMSRRGSREPERPHRRRRHKRFLSGWKYALFVGLTSVLLAGVGWLLVNDFCAFSKEDITATVQVTADDDLKSVANKLHDAGLIQYKWFFKFFGGLANANDKIGIGSYKLSTEMDYMALINAMHNSSGGMNTDTVRITIPEGYTVQQIIALLAKNGVNTEESLTEAAQTATFNYDFIDNTSQDISRLEGYLFPDTYDFYVNEKPESALRRLIANFTTKMDEDLMSEVEASGHSLKEIVTVASLIEKETAGNDQKTIASVIYNRLADTGSHGTYGMLQVDASLLYALPGHEGAITNDDKKVDSKYNLYKYAGLPPTPIANPGLASLKAALEPESTGYYFYALGKDGTHHFSATLQEHNSFINSDQYVGS